MYTITPFNTSSKVKNNTSNMTNTSSKTIVIPLVNVTEIEENFDSAWYNENGEAIPVKQVLGLEGMYPRWLGVGNITR